MGVIELQSVWKSYGDVHAVSGVSLRVDEGEVVALLGPNGAGKSTTFELLLGLIRPTRGAVRIFGDAPGGQVRARVGAMLQNAGLPEQVTVAELVRLIGRSYPRALGVDEALGRTGLLGRRRRTVSDLSGGERQRLLLAMAIIGAPALLLLDEPTAAMDVDARRAFWEQARASVADGATLLFATHDLNEADAVADRVVVLHDGEVIADAPPGHLKRTVSTTVVRIATDAPLSKVASLQGVESVEPDAAARPSPDGLRSLIVRVANAEQVLVPLVSSGYRIADLSVAQAALEDAFLHLTHQQAAATSATPTR